MEQCTVQHANDGLKAVEGFLSTTADLTKQMKPSFTLYPYLGGRVAVKQQQNRRKEGVCDGVYGDEHLSNLTVEMRMYLPSPSLCPPPPFPKNTQGCVSQIVVDPHEGLPKILY